MTQEQLTMTQMGILSEEVYKDIYFSDGNVPREKNEIVTEYGTYSIIPRSQA